MRPSVLLAAAPRSAARAALALALPLAAAACVSVGGTREPIVTDRPDFTESAETVPGGLVQVEGGATTGKADEVRSTSVGELLVRAGLGGRAELRVTVPNYTTVSVGAQRESGFEDAALGAKVRLVVPAEGASPFMPTAALLVGTTLPTASRAFRADAAQPEAKLALAWALGDRFALSSNLNYARVAADGARYDELGASLSLAAALADRVGAYAELFGFAPQVAGAGRPAYANGGVTWQLTPDFQLDVRAGVGVQDAPREHFIGAGFARRF